jgi:hypothetical protein
MRILYITGGIAALGLLALRFFGYPKWKEKKESETDSTDE